MASRLVQPCGLACQAKCAEIAKVERLQTEAAMATEAYKPLGERNVPGYREVTDPHALARLGLDREDLSPSDSQFRAAVFEKLDGAGGGTGDFTVAFKGTTMNSVPDWLANAGQGTVGYSDYYGRAKSIGRDAASAIGHGGVSSVKFVGHSLGGGLASAAAHATGQPATTFNAAGLHVFNRSWFNAPPIDAVRVNGEVLTGAQRLLRNVPILMPEGAGTPYPIDAPSTMASALERADLSWWDALIPAKIPIKYGKAALARAVDLHLMSSVNPALAEQHQRLKAAAAAAGCQC